MTNQNDEPLWDNNAKYYEQLHKYKVGLKQIRNKALKQLGNKFHENLRLVGDMLLLPQKLLAIEYHKNSYVPFQLKASIIAQLDMDINDENYSEHREKIYYDLLRKKYPKSTIVKDTIKYSKESFLNLLEDEDLGLRPTYQAMLYSCTVWTWCSYEILMKDLWEYALNVSGRSIVKNVTKKLTDTKISSDTNIFRRSISIDYLAQYDFDLSKKMGTALLYKFDFTSSKGIQEAYTYAFPKSIRIKNMLHNDTLIQLEASRNVIVHNAGVIDIDFCKKADTDISNVDKKLPLSNRKISEFINTSCEIGLEVMKSVSSIISNIHSAKNT